MKAKYRREYIYIILSACVLTYLSQRIFNIWITTSRNVTTKKRSVGLLPKIPRNVFYNRLPKCGSRSFLSVIGRLAKRNNFTFVKSSYNLDHDRPERKAVVEEIKKIAYMEPPTLYHRHMHYADFGTYGYMSPIYINIIRNPIERFVSHYNFMKYGDETVKREKIYKKWRPKLEDCVLKNVGICNTSIYSFYTGMYLCGQDAICAKPSRASVNLAKRHIDEDYAVIGMTEEFNSTMGLLEKVLPDYFAGATKEAEKYIRAQVYSKTKKLESLTKKAKEKMENHDLAEEMEIYYYAKAKYDRMKKQYGLI